MPKVLLNARFAARPLTGVDRVAVELTRALQDHYHRTGAPPFCGISPNGPLKLRDLNCADQRQMSNLRTLIWEQTKLPLLRPDRLLLSLCNIGPLFRRNQIVMLHDAQVFDAPGSYSRAFQTWYQFAQPIIARRAAAVVTVSEFARQRLEHHKIVKPGKAQVIHNGADHMDRILPDARILHKLRIKPQGFHLAIGSLAKHKNLKMLFRLMRDLPDQTLVVAGGPDANGFRQAGFAIPANVHCLGRVTDQELSALYGVAQSLLFPSLTEGFGLPPLEAMRCGCPVIATKAGAVPEILSDAALYCDPTQPRQWAKALHAVSSDHALGQALKVKGQKNAAQFTWAAAAEKLAVIIENAQLHTTECHTIGANPVGAAYANTSDVPLRVTDAPTEAFTPP